MALTEDDDFSVDDAVSLDSRWTRRIEKSVQWCESNWHVRISCELPTGLNSYALAGTHADGTAVVLKLRRPDEAMRTQNEALAAMGGQGVALLLERDDERGATLIKRELPGTCFASHSHNDAVNGIPDLVARFRTIEINDKVQLLGERADRWAWNLERFDRNTPLASSELKQAALDLRRLAETQTESPSMLHGNLHLRNLVASEQHGWVAIGPKGFVGESLFDIAWWLRDPPEITGVPMTDALRQRMSVLVNRFDPDVDRLLDWAEACAVLVVTARVAGMMWSDAERHTRCLDALRSLRA